MNRIFLLILYSILMALILLAVGHFLSNHFMQEALHLEAGDVEMSLSQELMLQFSSYFRSEFWVVVAGTLAGSHLIVFAISSISSAKKPKLELD